MTTPKRYDPTSVARTILGDVLEQHPTLWAAPFLIERIVADRKDKREIETAEEALEKLRSMKLIRLGKDELVEPTRAALGGGDPLGRL